MTKKIALCLLVSIYGSSSGFAAPVSEYTAQKTAESWLEQITNRAQRSIKAVSDKQIDLTKNKSGKALPPAYYIVNMDGGGWGIVAGDDKYHVPVIGYSTTGAIDPNNLPPTFMWWMDEVKANVEAAAQSSITSRSSAWKNISPAAYGIKTAGEGTVGDIAPLLTTTWNQGKYYNSKCPVDANGPDGHALTGCCATAYAQVMKYHNWPATGNGSNSYSHTKYGTLSANFGATTYNWSSMPSNGGLTSYNDAVATLMSHAGIAVNMNYGPSGSGCSPSLIASAFSKYFKYKPTSLQWKSSFTDAEWQAKIVADLNAQRPVLYVGWSGAGGHAFVVDGVSGANSDYFHFNWGWGGYSDGNFTLSTQQFNQNQGAIFGIEPDGNNNPPPAATLVSPSGSITNTKPAFTWNATSGATWYALYVYNYTSGKVSVGTTWYQGSSVCSGSTCSVVSPATLTGGNHSFWIQTWNPKGYGPWSNPMSFYLPGPPATATLVAPSGSITNTKPTFTWNAATDATWYALYVYNYTTGKVSVNTTWYQGTSVCSGSTCSVVSPATLTSGDHSFWIRTYNSTHGYGLWSNPMSFRLPGMPGKVILSSPSGIITNTKPTFTWSKDADVTWYYLNVQNTSTGKAGAMNGWYMASSVCSASTCSVTPAAALSPGGHRWQVIGWNTLGYGPWSDFMSFHLSGCYPGPVTLVSPIDTIANTKPAFTWSKDADANWYYLYAYNSSTGQLSPVNGWKAASTACASTTCSVTPTTPLEAGAYSWWVQPYSSCGGYGSWNGPRYFDLGFNSQFSGNAYNWYWPTGYAPWYVYSTYYFYTSGLANSWATAYYGTYLGDDTKYADFEYEAKMWRGSGEPYSTGIALRGEPLAASSGYWNSGYQFTYTRDGWFSVWQMQGTTATNLVAWTEHSAINQGSAWNTLRVRAVGSTIEFYINNIHVATVTNASLLSGKAGLMMYRGETTDYLYVDYARLTPVTLQVLAPSPVDGGIVVDASAAAKQAERPEGVLRGSPEGVDVDDRQLRALRSDAPAAELVPEETVKGNTPKL